MAWTGIARREHSREGLRYPSDMTDGERALFESFLACSSSVGRPRFVDMRNVWDVIQ